MATAKDIREMDRSELIEEINKLIHENAVRAKRAADREREIEIYLVAMLKALGGSISIPKEDLARLQDCRLVCEEDLWRNALHFWVRSPQETPRAIPLQRPISSRSSKDVIW